MNDLHEKIHFESLNALADAHIELCPTGSWRLTSVTVECRVTPRITIWTVEVRAVSPSRASKHLWFSAPTWKKAVALARRAMSGPWQGWGTYS